MPIHRVITHNGKAHFDEFFALGILLFSEIAANNSQESVPPVHRRDPTEGELDDPSVAVIDVGRRYDPEKFNFDHHQDESLPSSFRLVAQNYTIGGDTIDDLLAQSSEWYEYKDLLDRKGPTQAAKSVGVQGDTRALQSPIEGWIVSRFGSGEEPSREVVLMSALIAHDKIKRAKSVRGKLEDFRHQGHVEEVGHLRVFVVDREPDNFVIRQLREELGFDVTITNNPREEGGKAVYRYDDVDLDLKEAAYTAFPRGEEIIFAHNTGFLAVCEDLSYARDLVRAASKQ